MQRRRKNRDGDGADDGPKKTGLARRQVDERLADAGDARIRLPFWMGEAHVFARNLRRLTQMKDWTAEQACEALHKQLVADAEAKMAKAVGETKRAEATAELAKVKELAIRDRWYRRLMQEGATRSHGKTRTQFHGIARLFGVRYEDLWREDLVTFGLTDQLPVAKSESKAEAASPVPQKYARYTRCLAELLDDENETYHFLIPLIERLYASALAGEADFSRGYYASDLD